MGIRNGIWQGANRKDDRGAVAVVVALFLLIFIALLAFVVDLGRTYNVQSQLQNSADSAALAAAQNLTSTTTVGVCDPAAMTPDPVCAKAWEYAALNQSPKVDTTVTVSANRDEVKVDTRQPVDFVFGRIVGTSGTTANATATAAKVLAPGAEYGWYVGGTMTIQGGGTGLYIVGSTAYAKDLVWGGNDKKYIQWGLDSSTPGSTGANYYFKQDPPTSPSADNVLFPNSPWSETKIYETFQSSLPEYTAAEYASYSGLTDIIEGYRLGANLILTPKGNNPGKGECALDLGTLTSTAAKVYVYCQSGDAPNLLTISGTLPVGSPVKLIESFQDMQVSDNIGWNGTSCYANLILMAGRNLIWKGDSKTLCGTAYVPFGTFDSQGTGATIREGLVIAQNFNTGGNGGTFKVLPQGNPNTGLQTGIALIK